MTPQNPRISSVFWSLIVGLAYFALSRASLELINAETGLATVWPAAGLGLATLVLAPRRSWPALTAAMLVAGSLAQLVVRDTAIQALALGALAPAQSVVAALVLDRLVHGRPRIGSMGTVGALIVAGIGVTAVFALPGAMVLQVADSTTSTLVSSWSAWWLANAVGVLVVTPAILAVLEPGPDRVSRWETSGLVGLTGAIALLLFWHDPSHGPLALRFAYPILPLLLWCTVRIGARATTFATALVVMVASLATAHGLGPFAASTLAPHQRIQILQGFLAMAVLSTLLVGAVVADQRRARALARRDADRLAAVLNASSEVAIIATDLEMRITTFNRGAETMTGYGAADMVGRSPEILHDPAEIAARAAQLGIAPGVGVFTHAVREGGSDRRDWTYRHADGSLRRVSLTVTGQHDSAGQLTGYLEVATDVTQRDAQMRALRRAEGDLRTMFDQASIGQAIIGSDGKLAQGNAALEAITGYAPDLIREFGGDALIHPDDVGALRTLLAAVRSGERSTGEVEVRFRHRDGHTIDVALHAAALGGAGGEQGRTLVQVVDVTHSKRLEGQLRALADRDPLTGLLNRRRFDEELDAHLERCRRYGPEGAVVVLDVDGFKTVNDTRGHHAGDELITGIGALLRDRLRSSDVVARLGGDEFAVLLPRATRDEANLVAEALVMAVRDELDVTISLGVAMVGDGGCRSGDQLMIAADRAMYEAKAAGRDGHAFFVPA